MMIFEKARENAEEIKKGAACAIEEAKKAGAPAYYMDPDLGEGIIKEMPDGTRHRIKLIDGEDVVIETFGPKTRSDVEKFVLVREPGEGDEEYESRAAHFGGIFNGP